MNIQKPEITAVEDLMREHGLLNRLLLIYEEIIKRLEKDIYVSNEIVKGVAMVIQKFIENYHERTEENYVFPLLLKKNIDSKLIQELIEQHKISRKLTEKIIILSENTKINKKELIKNIYYFVKMYRYHESREDTIVFQDFRDSISEKEYKELGEKFEEEEHEILGENGYENTLKIVEDLEKYLNINDLSNITMEVKKAIFI